MGDLPHHSLLRSCALGGETTFRRTPRLLAAVAAFALGLSAAGTVGAAEPAASDRYAPVGWQLLGDFPFDDPGLGGLAGATQEALAERHQALPEAVRALDGERVSIRGFAVPAEMDGGRIASFMLLAQNDLDCSFGHALTMNQWILVSVGAETDVKLERDKPMRVSGRLEVGEEVQGGTVLSLYRMTADRVEPAP